MSQHSEVPIGFYSTALRRGWLPIVLGLVAGLLAAAGYLMVVPAQSTARTTVNLTVLSADPFNLGRSPSSLVDGPTESRLATSQAIAVMAAKALGQSDATSLRDRTSATVVTGGTVMDIQLTDSTDARARAGANAIAQAYLAYRAQDAKERIDRAVKGIEAQIDVLRPALEAAEKRLAAAPVGSPAALEAGGIRDEINGSIRALTSKRQQVLSVDTSSGTVITTADDNDVSNAPSRKIALASGALLGLISGALIALWWAARTHRQGLAANRSRDPVVESSRETVA